MIQNRPFERRFGSRKDHDRQIKTICQECSVGCGIVTYLKDGVIVDIHGNEDHPVNRGRLCARGIAFVQGLHNPARIMYPIIRKSLGEPFEEVEDWEGALDMCAERLRKIRDQHGPESVVIGCDQNAGHDFAIGAARFAGLLGTPHVYHPFDFLEGPYEGTPTVYPSSPCYEWGEGRCILFVEADMAATHPVAFGWVMDAKRRGAKIIAADTRFTRTLSKADMTLRILPRSGNLLGLALMKIILEGSVYHTGIRRDRLIDAEKWHASFTRLSWADLENHLGLGQSELRGIKDLIQKHTPVTVVTGKSLAASPSHGIWHTLVTAMGWDEAEGGGWYPLDVTTPPLDPCQGISEQSREQGADTKEAGSRHTMDRLREKVVNENPPFKALIGSGDLFSDTFSPLKDRTGDMDLIATFGAFPGGAVELCHMVFPSVLWAEKGGLFFSNDRSIQWSENVVEPAEGCRSGIDFWAGLARRFGWQDHFPWVREDGLADHLAYYQWLIEAIPATKGYTLDEVMSSSQAPKLHLWPRKKKGRKNEIIEPTYAPEVIESPPGGQDFEQYPLYFQKTPFVSQSGESGPYWPWTRTLEQEDAVQINPGTARALGIENGDAVIVTGSDGSLEGRAWISRVVPQWMVSAPRDSIGGRVLIRKKDRSSEETLSILRELLQ